MSVTVGGALADTLGSRNEAAHFLAVAKLGAPDMHAPVSAATIGGALRAVLGAPVSEAPAGELALSAVGLAVPPHPTRDKESRARRLSEAGRMRRQ